jgi:hypothetical protein
MWCDVGGHRRVFFHAMLQAHATVRLLKQLRPAQCTPSICEIKLSTLVAVIASVDLLSFALKPVPFDFSIFVMRFLALAFGHD